MPGKNMLSQAYKTLYECLAFLEHPVLRTVLIIVLVVFNSINSSSKYGSCQSIKIRTC